MNQFEENKTNNFNTDVNSQEYKYEIAYKRVKRIRDFYIHLSVYIIINAIIILTNATNWNEDGTDFWSWQTFATAFFWGIGLLANALSVFGSNWFFGAKSEEQKINELIQKEQNEKWE